jgi:hypothetical protein
VKLAAGWMLRCRDGAEQGVQLMLGIVARRAGEVAYAKVRQLDQTEFFCGK